jgi:hypothetical protein
MATASRAHGSLVGVGFSPSKTGSATSLQSLQEFASGKLARADRGSHPFPWIEVGKFLPTAVMGAINHFYPPARVMNSMPESRTGNVYAHHYRRLFPLNSTSIPSLDPLRAQFWIFFDRLIQNLAPTLLAALPEAPASQKVHSIAADCLTARIDLWADVGGYQIQPHTDAPHKLATYLLYCSEDPSLASEGTSLFEPLDPAKTCWTGRQWPFDDFSEVHTATYGSNRLFGFRKTDRSFHGKRPVGHHTCERRTIAITLQSRDHLVR